MFLHRLTQRIFSSSAGVPLLTWRKQSQKGYPNTEIMLSFVFLSLSKCMPFACLTDAKIPLLGLVLQLGQI